MIISEQLPLVTSWHANKFCFRTSIQRVLKKKLKKRLKIQIKCVFNWKWFWKICHCFISLHTIDEGFLTIKLHFKAGMGGKDGVGNKSVDILTVVLQVNRCTVHILMCWLLHDSAPLSRCAAVLWFSDSDEEHLPAVEIPIWLGHHSEVRATH